MSVGEVLSLPRGEKARVDPAVVAHSQPATAQIDNLHCVRMAALCLERMTMVAAVRCLRSTRRNCSDKR